MRTTGDYGPYRRESTAYRRPMAPPMTISGTSKPDGSVRLAASAVKVNQKAVAAMSAETGSACGAPRRKRACATSSTGWSSSVAAELYWLAAQRSWESISTAAPVKLEKRHASSQTCAENSDATYTNR